MTLTKGVQILLICLLVGALFGGATLRVAHQRGFEQGLKFATDLTGAVCKVEGYAGWQYEIEADDPAATARCMIQEEMENISTNGQ